MLAMSDFTVRAAVPDDAAGIAGTRVRSWQRVYRGIVPDDVLDGLDPDASDGFRRMLDQPTGDHGAVVAADRDGVVIAFALFGPYRIDPANGGGRPHPTEGEVYAIYAEPAHWGRGVGAAIMEATLRELSARGRHPVRLWVLRANERARRFYERVGFALDGETSVFRLERGGDPPVELDEVRYVLDGRRG